MDVRSMKTKNPKNTPRKRLIAALERRKPSGRVPTFELAFFLTMERFGKTHPSHRFFHQWDQMSRNEKNAQIQDAAEVYIKSARHYEHCAIFVTGIEGIPDSEMKLAQKIRELTEDEFFIMRHGDATLAVPGGKEMETLSYQLADEPECLKGDFSSLVDRQLELASSFAGTKVFDGFALCSDYCLNSGPFLSPSQFSEFVAPYLERLISGYRQMGFYTIKHTDGNIMPIIEQIVQCKPDALHSLDPQAGIDIAEIKKKYGDKVCLIGNVNCGLLQTGTDEQVIESAAYALRSGMPGGAYVFSTSNCIYTGMSLERYDLMLDVWRKQGIYAD